MPASSSAILLLSAERNKALLLHAVACILRVSMKNTRKNIWTSLCLSFRLFVVHFQLALNLGQVDRLLEGARAM